MAVDQRGLVWFTDPGYGILGHYEGEESDFENRLFMTAGTSLYAVYLNSVGAQWP